MAEEKKAVEIMNKEECLAELEELAEEVDFEDAKWNKRTSLEDLQGLVTEGREALESEEEGSEDNNEDSEDEEVELNESSVPKGPGVHIFDAEGNYVRTYSKKVHGEDFSNLAKKFVKKPGREGYTTKVSK